MAFYNTNAILGDITNIVYWTYFWVLIDDGAKQKIIL